MSADRLAALEAVAEAAARTLNEWDKSLDMESVEDLRDALRTYHALPAAPTQAQGETVEVWTHTGYGERVCLPGARFADPGWRWRGRLRLDTSNPPIRATKGGGE